MSETKELAVFKQDTGGFAVKHGITITLYGYPRSGSARPPSTNEELIVAMCERIQSLDTQLAEATRKLEEASKDVEPDMFWDAANPEDSFNENPHEIACTLSENLQLGEEAVFDIQCAISLADRKMRVKLDANGDFDWEWVDQAIEQGKGGDDA
jgi:hypothetical protein